MTRARAVLKARVPGPNRRLGPSSRVPNQSRYQKSYFCAFGGPETGKIELLALPFDDQFSGSLMPLAEAVLDLPIEGFPLIRIVDFNPQKDVPDNVLRV